MLTLLHLCIQVLSKSCGFVPETSFFSKSWWLLYPCPVTMWITEIYSCTPLYPIPYHLTCNYSRLKVRLQHYRYQDLPRFPFYWVKANTFTKNFQELCDLKSFFSFPPNFASSLSLIWLITQVHTLVSKYADIQRSIHGLASFCVYSLSPKDLTHFMPPFNPLSICGILLTSSQDSIWAHTLLSPFCSPLPPHPALSSPLSFSFTSCHPELDKNRFR